MGIGCKKKTPNQPQTTVQNKSQYQLFPQNEAISSPWAWGAARAPSSPPCPHAARGLRPARLFWGGFCSWDPAPRGVEGWSHPNWECTGAVLSSGRDTLTHWPVSPPGRENRGLEKESTQRCTVKSGTRRNKLEKYRHQGDFSKVVGGNKSIFNSSVAFQKKNQNKTKPHPRRVRGTSAFREKTQKPL